MTDPVCTVIDMAGLTDFACGLMVADAALSAGLVTTAALQQELRARAGRRGVARAREVVAAADGLAESAGESLSRARILQAHLPPPALQQTFRDPDGFIGRCDFYWHRQRVVGEFDGRIKYGGQFEDQGSAEDRLWREKRREDRLRALGLRVVRWVWDDALRAEPLVRALGRAGITPQR